MSDLLIIVPSRGRPGNIARLLDSVHELKRIETHIHVGVDDDDPSVDDYQRVIGKAGQEGDVLTVGERNGLAGWTNKIALEQAENYRFLASFGDDHLPRTKGFDKFLCRGIEDMGGTGFTYPWDGVREDIPEAVVMSSDIVQALGWMCLPALQHYYVDNVWGDLGFGAGCIRHLRAITVEHVHPLAGKAKGDKTYAESSEKLAADRAAYHEWRSVKMTDDVNVIVSLKDHRLQPA